MCIHLSLGIIVCELFFLLLHISLEKFLAVLQVGVMVCIVLPPHTHIVHIMSGALYQGLCNLELEGIV